MSDPYDGLKLRADQAMAARRHRALRDAIAEVIVAHWPCACFTTPFYYKMSGFSFGAHDHELTEALDELKAHGLSWIKVEDDYLVQKTD